MAEYSDWRLKSIKQPQLDTFGHLLKSIFKLRFEVFLSEKTSIWSILVCWSYKFGINIKIIRNRYNLRILGPNLKIEKWSFRSFPDLSLINWQRGRAFKEIKRTQFDSKEIIEITFWCKKLDKRLTGKWKHKFVIKLNRLWRFRNSTKTIGREP